MKRLQYYQDNTERICLQSKINKEKRNLKHKNELDT